MQETLQSLFSSVSLFELTIVAGSVLIAGFIRGFVGFGAALIIVMVLSAVFGPVAAVPAANLSGLPATVQLLPNAIRHSERPFVIPFGLASFAIAPLGVFVLVSVDPAVMRMTISIFVLLMVLVLVRGWRLSQRPGPVFLAGAGATAGLVQGATSASGPLAVVLALSRSGSPIQQRANVIGAVTSLNLCALIPFWYQGLFTLEVLLLSIIIMPLYSIAIWVGARFFTERGQNHFRNAALLTLAIVGVVTLALAVVDYVSAA